MAADYKHVEISELTVAQLAYMLHHPQAYQDAVDCIQKRTAGMHPADVIRLQPDGPSSAWDLAHKFAMARALESVRGLSDEEFSK